MSLDPSSAQLTPQELPSELSENDEKALEKIVERGSMLQSELWKTLDVSSRTGSRIAKRLADQNLIERNEVVAKGRSTYKLVPVTHRVLSEIGDDLPLSQRVVRVVESDGPVLEDTVISQIDGSAAEIREAVDDVVSRELIKFETVNVYGREKCQLKPLKRD